MNAATRGVIAAICCAMVCGIDSPRPIAIAADEVRFDVNDLSYLWPVPVAKADVDELLSAAEMTADGASSIWPTAAFDALLQTAKSVRVNDSAGRPNGITFGQFEQEFARQDRWKVAAFRIDPSAPGGHPGAVAQFGSTPQLRVILQPVTMTAGSVVVHDFTAHLAFSFKLRDDPPAAGGRFPRAVPDKELFRQILEELKALKADSEKGGAVTVGPLGVHPGLRVKVPGFATKVKGFLKHRMSEARLTEMAFMGVDAPEPWIFFGMRRDPSGAFVQLRPPSLAGKDAEMLILRGGKPVMPEPTTFNMPPQGGVSTHLLFAGPTGGLNLPVFPSVPRPLHSDIPDIIANPRITNVLNADCVSCHSESTRRKVLNLTTDGTFRYTPPAGISGVNDTLVPSSQWNVRNFGWFRTDATVTVRTANETAEAVDLVNREYFGLQPVGPVPTGGGTMEQQPQHPPVASPLTLVMDIKSQQDFLALKALLEQLQGLPQDQNPIAKALNRLGTVHFARFVFLSERQLAVITTYDGRFDDYIDAFVNAIGAVFDKLLAHMSDAPPLPVSDNRKAFLDYVRKHDLTGMPPFYSAYPSLKVLDILTLQKQQGGG